jgi:hypothetical protein
MLEKCVSGHFASLDCQRIVMQCAQCLHSTSQLYHADRSMPVTLVLLKHRHSMFLVGDWEGHFMTNRMVHAAEAPPTPYISTHI